MIKNLFIVFILNIIIATCIFQIENKELNIFWFKTRNYIQERTTQIRKLCTVHCGMNVNKASAPIEVWRERTKSLMWYYSPTKNKLIYQSLDRILMIFDFLVLTWKIRWQYIFPSKMMHCPWILCFDLLPLQNTDLTHAIWRFLVIHTSLWEYSVYGNSLTER